MKSVIGASQWKRGALGIAAANLAGQLTIGLAAPILSRIYSPADFGAYSTASVFLTTLGTVAALRFEAAIILPQRDRDAYSVMFLGLLCSMVIGLVAGVVFLVFGSRLASALHQPALWPWILLVPPGIAFTGAFLCLNQLALRKQRFGAVAQRNLLQAVLGVISQIAAGGTSVLKSGGLLLGVVLGQLFGVLSLLTGSNLRGQDSREGFERKSIEDNARRYRRFAIVLAPSALLNVAGLQVPILLVATYYGAESAGWLGLTQRVFVLPVAVVAGAITQVYASRFAQMLREGSPGIRSLFNRTSRRLAAVAIVPVLVVLVAGPELFSFVFGDQWHRSGEYAQALAVVLGAQMVAAPVSSSLILLEKTGTQLAWDSSRFAIACLSVAGAAYFNRDDLFAIRALGISSSIAYATLWAITYRQLSKIEPVTRNVGRHRD